MKDLSRQGSLNSLSPQARTIAMFAMLLFALSGMISGFSLGAFGSSKTAQPATVTPKRTTIVQKNQTHTPTVTVKPIPLGYPVIDQASSPELADGTTVYTFSAHAVDRSIDRSHGKPIHRFGITCRLWLMPITQNPGNIPAGRLQSPETLQSSPLPGEVTGLIFDATTPQTQPCNANGQGLWKYQVSTSVATGKYYLVVLTDWKGIHYDWSWIPLKINQ